MNRLIRQLNLATWSGLGAPRVAYPLAAAVLGALLLVGCTVGPKYNKPSAPIPANYKEDPANFPDQQVWKVADAQQAMLRGKWWELFNDAELNAL